MWRLFYYTEIHIYDMEDTTDLKKRISPKKEDIIEEDTKVPEREVNKEKEKEKEKPTHDGTYVFGNIWERKKSIVEWLSRLPLLNTKGQMISKNGYNNFFEPLRGDIKDIMAVQSTPINLSSHHLWQWEHEILPLQLERMDKILDIIHNNKIPGCGIDNLVYPGHVVNHYFFDSIPEDVILLLALYWIKPNTNYAINHKNTSKSLKIKHSRTGESISAASFLKLKQSMAYEDQVFYDQVTVTLLMQGLKREFEDKYDYLSVFHVYTVFNLVLFLNELSKKLTKKFANPRPNEVNRDYSFKKRYHFSNSKDIAIPTLSLLIQNYDLISWYVSRDNRYKYAPYDDGLWFGSKFLEKTNLGTPLSSIYNINTDVSNWTSLSDTMLQSISPRLYAYLYFSRSGMMDESPKVLIDFLKHVADDFDFVWEHIVLKYSSYEATSTDLQSEVFKESFNHPVDGYQSLDIIYNQIQEFITEVTRDYEDGEDYWGMLGSPRILDVPFDIDSVMAGINWRLYERNNEGGEGEETNYERETNNFVSSFIGKTKSVGKQKLYSMK